MTFEREDFDKLLKERLAERREQMRPAARRAVQAELATQEMTGTPAWDYFRSRVKGQQEEARSRQERAQEILLGATANQEALMSAKLAYAESKGAVEALQAVLDLPVEIEAEGKQARETLEE